MTHRFLLPVLAATVLGLSACGSDQDTASPGAQSTPMPSDMPGMSTPAADASPYDASSGKVTIKATEFAFGPSQIQAKAGKLEITMENDGAAVHELVVLKTDADPGSLKVTDGRVGEADSVGEISETNPGKSASHTFDLKPGKYLIVCNVKGHYMQGMRGQIVVS
ncbi:MAG: plastocyanin/azurin family copper-binding protein [Solirubrobacteraceae bacterium]|nr:cupredoxin domain-containing protein [Patulibacter sp.]